MRGLVLLGLLGCACTPTPVVKLRVDPSAAAKLDASRRDPAQATIVAARKALVQAQADLDKAVAERASPATAAGKQRTKELDDILRASEGRRTAHIAWRKAQLEVARWHAAASEAQLELITAEVVTRHGVDVDPAHFRAQVADLQSGRTDASRKATVARAQLDQREKDLSDAKARYAATVKAAPAAPAPPATAATP